MPILHPYEAFDFAFNRKINGTHGSFIYFLVSNAKRIQIGKSPRKRRFAIAYGETINEEIKNKNYSLCEVPNNQMMNSFSYSIRKISLPFKNSTRISSLQRTNRDDDNFAFRVIFSNQTTTIFSIEKYKIALLSINEDLTTKNKKKYTDTYLFLLVLAALDYKLIGCTKTLCVPKMFFDKLFIEFHIFAGENDSIDCIKDRGYTFYYVYSSFSCKNIQSSNNRFVQIMKYSGDTAEALDSNILSCPQVTAINGLTPILIYNIPLYKKENDVTPSKLSGKTVVYVKYEQFEIWSPKRVAVYFEGVPFFADFVDLHKLKPELCVESQIYLSDTSETIKNVKQIKADLEKANSSGKIKFKEIKGSLTKLPLNTKVLNVFNNYLYYSPNFGIRESQIFAVYEASQSILNKSNNQLKGTIYQIDTGEGKTAIINAIAAIVASEGKKVHIASSNIELAKRDWENSQKMFQDLKISSSILIHKSECENNNFKIDFPENGCDMNIDCFDDAQIVFGTFLNFEGAYLHLLEDNPQKAEEIKNKVLLIDEADNMLIDEITNGTIISKEIQSNVEDVLQYFYETMKKTENFSAEAEEIRLNINEKFKECKLKIEDVKQLYNDYNEAIKKTLLTDYIIHEKTHEIIPFDQKNKGMSEPSKEFMGCIQQFIAIKENEKLRNDGKEANVKIKPLSFTTMYISHQIYVKCYDRICGFTGTIGNKVDKEIFNKKYNLETFKIQRNKPNMRIDLPKLVAKDEKEKFKLIMNEIKSQRENGVPVLIIFQEINEIERFAKALGTALPFYNYQKFLGTEKIDTKKLDECGEPCAITLSTNCLGRGIHIPVPPNNYLHIIFTYNTSNERVIYQAFGRTARSGNKGSARIICTRDSNIKAETDKRGDIKGMMKACDNLLRMFENRSYYQNEFMNIINAYVSWIFCTRDSFNNKLDKKQLAEIRENEIIVSRDTASEFKFSLGLTLTRFIEIQCQRIASLYNCPNTKYTWFIVAKYFRELILESWSILTDNKTDSINEDTINKVIYALKDVLPGLEYPLPEKPKELNIVDCFINVMKYVKKNYYTSVYPSFQKRYDTIFKPRTILNSFEIGSKIGIIMQKTTEFSGVKVNEKKIRDLQYKYVKKGTAKTMNTEVEEISISKKVDDLIIQLYLQLKERFGEAKVDVYFKRTLVGPEIGIFIKDDCLKRYALTNKDPDMLCDTDPMFTASICLRSTEPVLAGIIIKFFKLFGLSRLTGFLDNQFHIIPSIQSLHSEFEHGNSSEGKLAKIENAIENEKAYIMNDNGKKYIRVFAGQSRETKVRAMIVIYANSILSSFTKSNGSEEKNISRKYENNLEKCGSDEALKIAAKK